MGIYNVWKPKEPRPYPFPCTIRGRVVYVQMEKFWKACKEKVDADPKYEWDESVVQGLAPV